DGAGAARRRGEARRPGVYGYRYAAARNADSANAKVSACRGPIGRWVGALELRQRRERRELLIHVPEEQAHDRDDQHRHEHDGPKNEALMDDRAIGLEAALRRRLGRRPAALLLEQRDELVRLEIEILRVVA